LSLAVFFQLQDELVNLDNVNAAAQAQAAAQLDLQELQEILELTESLEFPVTLENLAVHAHQAQLQWLRARNVPPETKANLEALDLPVHQDPLVIQETKETQANQAPKGQKELQAVQAHLAQMEKLVLKVHPVHQVKLVEKVQLDPRDLQVKEAQLVHLVLLEAGATTASPETKAQRDPLVNLVQLVALAALVDLVKLVSPAKMLNIALARRELVEHSSIKQYFFSTC